MTTDRRMLLGAVAVTLAWPRVAFAREDFAIDWQGAEPDAAVAKSMAEQIALVKALPVSPAAMAFFRAEPIKIDSTPGARTRAFPAVLMAREAVPADNPVLLHEFIHRWQLARMPGGRRNPQVVAFFEEAKAAGIWPARAYMLTNPFEFFAMMASVVLHGRAARPPYTRDAVRTRAPALYAFIVEEFGFRGG